MIVRTGWLADLRCAECGGAPVVAVSPGSEAPRVLDLFLEARGEPARGWCLACAARRGWLEAAA